MKKLLTNIPNCCKLQIAFKTKARICNNFYFKDSMVLLLLFISCKVWTLQWILLWGVGETLECKNWLTLTKKLSLRIAPSPIIYSFATILHLKDTLSALSQFLAIESPLKRIRNASRFTLKVIFVLKISKLLL